MALPGDPILLLSFLNMKLRDFYPSLDALCKTLSAVGYQYDPQRNQFV